MEKIIYNSETDKIIILDVNNKIIKNLISDYFIIKDIDFNVLPSNIINKPEIYLGKEYKKYEFKLEVIKELLFGSEVYHNKENNWYYYKNEQVYSSQDNNTSLVLANYTLLYPFSRKFNLNSTLVRCLCGGLVDKHYGFNIDLVW